MLNSETVRYSIETMQNGKRHTEALLQAVEDNREFSMPSLGAGYHVTFNPLTMLLEPCD